MHDGYALLSTRKIAARAGMRPGNLQYYYRTKEDVVRAVLGVVGDVGPDPLFEAIGEIG